MKRIILCLIAAMLLLPGYSEAANKQLEKARKKELNQKLKEYKKGKWEIMGSHTLDFALAKHFDRLNTLGDDAHEVEGISTKTKSKNTGKQAAINNAVVTYAQEAGSTLQGRVVSDMNANGADPSGEFDNFYAAYERLVEKEIRGEMEPSYSIIRTNPDGTYEIRTYFIITESAASKARMRALEEALKNSEAAQKYGAKITEFVKQGFE
ncbi:MAG: hypothetical protein HDS12_01415 [Bacteroides sp.]|nr:hypothetical protein [Bacteroidales bacterium]MBD5223385.1 hypothetical protein [Bacteroidales bacterium]MBD5302672.1 hypothetical protein [Bacteroides sp.]MBD5304940.1 hypothetical protein [Bacteroides sp.]MBD5347669.1 hypothetical protein [Bacteroides sp.]